MSRRRSSTSFEESLAQFRGIIDNLPRACAFYDVIAGPPGDPVERRFLDANPAFERLTGIRRKDLIGRTAAERLPEIAQALEDACGRAASTGVPESFEHVRPSPKEGWWNIFAYLASPGHFVIIISDITERKRAEAELRESREKFQALIETTSDFIWETDARGRYTYCSPQMERLWGIKPADMIGRTPFDVMPDNERAGALEEFADLSRSARPFSGLASTAVLPDGRLVRGETDGVPFFDAEGRLAGFRGITRDVTDRKQAEADLRESEAKANALIKYAPTAIYEIDFRGPRFTSVNDAMCRILGYTRDELLALSPAEVLDEESRARFADRIRRQIAGEKIEESVEYGVRKKNGEIIAALLNVSVSPTGQEPHKVFVIAHDITPRKRMEKALEQARAEAEKRARDLEIVMDAVPAGVMLTRDHQGENIAGNRATHEILRVPSGVENISKSAPDPEKRRTYRPFRNGVEIKPEQLPVQRAARGEEVRDWDCDLVFDDGEVRHVIVNAAPLQQAGEEFRGAVGAFIDVTDRRREEQARRRDRERFELLSQTAGRLLETEDPQSVIDELCRKVMTHLDCQLFFNFLVDKAAQRLRLNACAGVPEEALRSLKYQDFGAALCGLVAKEGQRIVAEDIPARPDARTDLVASFGVTAYAVYPLMAGSEVLGTLSFGAKNRARFSDDDLSLMKTVADQVAVAIERLRDQQTLRERGLELQRLTATLEIRVRERTRELAVANEQLRVEVGERLRLVAAVEQADEGVVIMDEQGRIGYANSAFEKRSGHPRSRLLSMRYAQLLKDPKNAEDFWAGIKGSIERGEAWHGRMSRGGENGVGLELEVTVSPIYDGAKRLINYLAVERDITAEVRLQEHLRQVQKIEALGTLAGGIAHDFNNILNPIFISMEIALLDPSLDLAIRRHLEVALKAAQRGRDLVKQVIAFSRQKEKEKKPTRVGPVVREAVNFLRVTLPSTIEIGTDIEEGSGCILGDQAQIHQVVMNLCSNAAFAMRLKGGILSVGLKAIDVDAKLESQVPGLTRGPYLRLTVMDTGTGITPEVRERLFDPFFTTKAPGEGAGMGLPVVDGIVRDYGGAIAVDSEVDRGSIFAVYLPRIAEEEARTEGSPDSLPTGSARILLIDDEEVQVYSVRSVLEKFGYEVVPFTDGKEALSRFLSDPQAFDLVITDQTMPHLTGLQIAGELLKARPDIPIILCTGFSETVDAQRARSVGVREFLMKPYSIREITETVRRALADSAGV